MRKESIIEMIDKRIIENFVNGYSPEFITSDLKSKTEKMSDFITNQGIDIEKFIDLDFEVLTDDDFTKEKLPMTRTKYTVYYVKHSRKRINDINWVVENSKKFPHLSKSQVFKLIKLKEKLSRENATDLPF